MTGAGAAKGHAGRAKGKAFGYENARALMRAAKAACAGLPSAQVLGLIRELDFPAPGVLDRTLSPVTWRQTRYGPAAGRKSSQAGNEDRCGEPGNGKRDQRFSGGPRAAK
jgi:hypothetical protein